MKVSVSKTVFEPVEITITLEDMTEVRSLRRLFGGLPHSDLRNAVNGSNIKGDSSDSDTAAAICTRLYEITRKIYDKPRKEGS